MKSTTPRLDEIKALIKRLNALLDDPQPGLLTWCEAYDETMQKIIAFWEAGK